MARQIRSVSLVLVLLTGAAAAGDLAREGPVDTSMCFGGPMQVAASGGVNLGTYLVKGGTSASATVFDSMAVACSGTFETRGGQTQSRGQCVFRDADGDTIHGTDALTPAGYVWSYVGGTGKFKGITGSGAVQRWSDLGPAGGELRGCRRLVGTYKMG